MIKIHNLFYSSDSEKQTLHRRIVPIQGQQELQQERWNDLCDYLIQELKELSGYVVSSWLQGSYKLGTQVRPIKKGGEFDIDLGVYFKWDGKHNEGKFSPQKLKSFTQDSLLRYKDNVKVISPPKERCSRICFSGDFHIDVSSYHLDEKRDVRALATEGHQWEHSDPIAFYEWFRENFVGEENSQARRLIRYTKIWSFLHLKKPPSSILLTVLVAEAFLELADEDKDGDDVALKNVSIKIIERLKNDYKVVNPVNSDENLNRLTENETNNFIQKLCDVVKIADRALAASTEFEAATIWSEVFHHFFPVPQADPTDAHTRALIPARFVPNVFVRAVPRENKYHQYTGEDCLGPIPRNCDIYFELRNSAELPYDSRVQWIVRNEGEEAEYKNDLGHLVTENEPWHAKEKSMYKGTHFMDIVVTSSLGELIGFKRIPVEISGIFMPPRNPKKPKKSYFYK